MFFRSVEKMPSAETAAESRVSENCTTFLPSIEKHLPLRLQRKALSPRSVLRPSDPSKSDSMDTAQQLSAGLPAAHAASGGALGQLQVQVSPQQPPSRRERGDSRGSKSGADNICYTRDRLRKSVWHPATCNCEKCPNTAATAPPVLPRPCPSDSPTAGTSSPVA